MGYDKHHAFHGSKDFWIEIDSSYLNKVNSNSIGICLIIKLIVRSGSRNCEFKSSVS